MTNKGERGGVLDSVGDVVLNACLINIVEVRHGPMYHGDAFTDVDTVGGLCFGR